ncbi:unnamed protein product [Caenorhabditis auriculariae]|uniref:Uncharacterized protein n=1 Tax=Caenorhabditis auriculariae TaxID=2777116 RepID=A0A8S1GZY9_9PELO|nr:unnamed protein product [Caenorhabditis auriculariae]
MRDEREVAPRKKRHVCEFVNVPPTTARLSRQIFLVVLQRSSRAVQAEKKRRPLIYCLFADLGMKLLAISLALALAVGVSAKPNPFPKPYTVQIILKDDFETGTRDKPYAKEPRVPEILQNDVANDESKAEKAPLHRIYKKAGVEYKNRRGVSYRRMERPTSQKKGDEDKAEEKLPAKQPCDGLKLCGEPSSTESPLKMGKEKENAKQGKKLEEKFDDLARKVRSRLLEFFAKGKKLAVVFFALALAILVTAKPIPEKKLGMCGVKGFHCGTPTQDDIDRYVALGNDIASKTRKPGRVWEDSKKIFKKLSAPFIEQVENFFDNPKPGQNYMTIKIRFQKRLGELLIGTKNFFTGLFQSRPRST